jgi:hypothetical protein
VISQGAGGAEDGVQAGRPTGCRQRSTDQESDMTTLAQHRSTVTAPFVAVALAISVLGGIVGGAVAVTIPSVIEARAADDQAQAEAAKWQKYGQEWETRYRQMYPIVN